jgi:mannonate dehydratase
MDRRQFVGLTSATVAGLHVYRDVGYDGMITPDQVPTVEGDANRLQGFAFAFGYIKALIAAIAAET